MISSSNSYFQRTAGALMPIFSLPGPYGIGVLGREARKFADLLVLSGLHCWQVLPMVHAGAGNSPYSGVSAFAGDPLYIDPEKLYEKGLITLEELEESIYPHSTFQVDYEWLSTNKPAMLRKAFGRLTPTMWESIHSFIEENSFWLKDYALYMTLKEIKQKISSKEALSSNEASALEKEETYLFYCYLQYEFYEQWVDLKTYCNERGIGIIGDLPFYVSYDSSDVWGNPQLFCLNKDLEPVAVAGTPPDYFSEDGQCWGNPLYDWDEMKREDYDWWMKRISFHLIYNDALRIDHFRGFDRYYTISSEHLDAKKGLWEDGPGLELFQVYKNKYGEAPIIAEDLGTVDERFFAFLKECGFPGMRVIQFAFDGSSNNHHFPHNYIENTVAYTGTHDNNTTLGWIWEASEKSRRQAIQYCHIPEDNWSTGGAISPVCRSFLRTLYQSVARIVIAPVQDYCGFGADTRVNIPGKPTDNWKFRFTTENLEQIDKDFLIQISNTYGRNQSFNFKNGIN